MVAPGKDSLMNCKVLAPKAAKQKSINTDVQLHVASRVPFQDHTTSAILTNHILHNNASEFG
eukprot:3732924-Amphidinium_carterae.1